jgi:Na+-driven multidrug efflux pump
MAGIVTIVTTLFIVFWGHLVMSMFTKDPDVIKTGDQYLTIVSIFYFMFTLMFIYNGIMRGAGDTLLPMFFSIISLWLIRIPMAYFLSGEIGSQGIWWAIPVGWFAGLSLSFIYYKTGRWKTRSVVKYDENA